MHLQTLRASVLAAVVAFCMGCPTTASEPQDGGSDGAGGGGGTGAVTYTKDVQPILKAKCAPCHTETGSGNHNVATNYADVNKPVEAFDFGVCWKDTEMTMPKKVGECALLLINSGQMPLGAGCGGAMPLQPEACLTDAQKGVISVWVAAGMPQ
jgi:uncharacterized spore protein YtfJ